MCKLKRTLSIIICIVICVGLLTSCNNGGGSKPVFENGKYVPQEEMEITVWQTQGTDFTSKVLDDSIVKEWLENKTKVKVDNAYGNDGGQWDAKLTKLVAGNNLPEIVACGAYQGPAHFAKLDQLGQVWELTPEMLKKYAPNVWERVPEKYWNAIKVDGKILGIPYGASEISNKTHPKATEQELETMKTLYKTPYNDITIAGIQTLWVRDDILRKFYPDAMTYDEITKLLDKNMSPEEILHDIFDEFGLEITDTIDTRFRCNCSKERVSRAIRSIDRKDIKEMINEGNPVEVNCHFCGTNYIFTTDELQKVLDEKKD